MKKIHISCRLGLLIVTVISTMSMVGMQDLEGAFEKWQPTLPGVEKYLKFVERVETIHL